MAVRWSKILLITAIALFASLVAFGNITDYNSNFSFVRHVLLMDTIFPDSTISYRAIHSPVLHHAAYLLIIGLEVFTALLCWWGAGRLLVRRKASAYHFNRAKNIAVCGLTLGFLLWQVGFMSVGGEWFGMWMSSEWNGIQSAFQFFVTIMLVLIYVVFPDTEVDGNSLEK